MKVCVINAIGLPLGLAALVSVLSGQASAQTFTILHNFTDVNPVAPYTNSDGAYPVGGLILAGNTVYGTTEGGGSSGIGTVFLVKTDGTGFSILHNFAGINTNSLGVLTNDDGAAPAAALVLSDNVLYGTAADGGNSGIGTVFKLNIDGSGFTNVYMFHGDSDGGFPQAPLVLSGNTLYGTAFGPPGNIFAVETDGSGFTNLHSFTDGGAPLAGLVLSGNTLYGTTSSGGTWGQGSVFKINTDGTGFTNLHSFNYSVSGEGASPQAGLTLSGNILYGTTSGPGTIFKLATDGSSFTTLYNFPVNIGRLSTLVLCRETLYGTSVGDTYRYKGAVFSLSKDGTNFTTLLRFGQGDGVSPVGSLILSGNILYGTANYGGSYGGGTVFGVSVTPQLTITPSISTVVLSWSTNFAGFTVQHSFDLSSTGWTTYNLQAPLIISNGQFMVPIPNNESTQRFFRLGR